MIQDGERLHAALERETRGLAIGPSPLTEMIRVGAARRMRRRTAVVTGTVALVALPAAMLAFASRSGGGSNISSGHTPLPTPAATSKTSPAVLPASSAPKNQQAQKDQIVVLDGGTFQGRPWRLVRDRFVLTAAADQGTARNLLAVEHLPFSDYGKPGTVACEALGFQFGGAAPGTLPDYNGGVSCGEVFNPDPFAAPKHFVLSGFDNGMDKKTGKSTILQAFGYGPAAGSNGSTATSASLTVAGVAGDRKPLVTAPGENVAYFAFLAPATADPQPKVTITFYDAHGDQVGTADAKSFSAPG